MSHFESNLLWQRPEAFSTQQLPSCYWQCCLGVLVPFLYLGYRDATKSGVFQWLLLQAGNMHSHFSPGQIWGMLTGTLSGDISALPGVSPHTYWSDSFLRVAFLSWNKKYLRCAIEFLLTKHLKASCWGAEIIPRSQGYFGAVSYKSWPYFFNGRIINPVLH